jgi:antitoxin Phd
MAEILRFRNARGELVEVENVPATRLKNGPAGIIDAVAGGKAVAITRHNSARAVILSCEDFRELARAREPSLAELSAQFDQLLAHMQAPKSKKALAAAFESSPEELGRSAVEAAGRGSRLPRAVAAKRVKRGARKRGAR